MDHFVKIITLYNASYERETHNLSEKYKDLNGLLDVIHNLIYDDLIKINHIRGKNIMIKPNWVLHNRKPSDEICLRTNKNFLLAALENILKAEPAKVCLGDAPIQGCDWSKILTKEFSNQIDILKSKYGIPILIKDFRRTTFVPGANNPQSGLNPLSDYVIFDVGKDSYLESVSSDTKSIFRVTDYNPDRLTESHRKGVHKYCITKELFEADIILSLPKIKTHQKTGITGALKNIVGLNGNKDFLPHHRIGGTGFGGDCYPGSNYFRYWAELSLDQANKYQGKALYWFWTFMSDGLWALSRPKNVHNRVAGWYGNDTTWRMVLDLNKIVLYGCIDGSLATKPQRKIYSLGDGIIAGQGDGPLKPNPLPLGVVTFTDDSTLHDLAVCLLMKFDIAKIPILKTIDLVKTDHQSNIFINEQKVRIKELDRFGVVTLPPPGWVEYLNKQ